MTGRTTPRELVSPREREVLAALGERLTNAEIAERLHISERTVESHVSALLRKLGGTDRRSLGRAAFLILDAEPEVVNDNPGLGNLPRPQTRFVGSTERGEWNAAASDGGRLMTLVGPGGIGKTRVAIEIARQDIGAHPNGIWFVDLGAVAESGAVPGAVASTLTIPLHRNVPTTESIADWLTGRGLLLILDNCEHVLDAVVPLVTAILDRCATVNVVATSRAPLGVPGETVRPVAPLGVDAAVELFHDRAITCDPMFSFDDPVDRDAIADLCGHLDGLPLAIELAASRARLLSPIELVARLGAGSLVLGDLRRDPGDRHHTMEATIAWSYRLLASRARIVFDRVSVFAGGFGLAAAEHVAAGDGVDVADVVDLLGSLVDSSLVTVARDGPVMRYRLLEPLRQVAAKQLDRRAETADVRHRHLAHYCESAAGLAEGWMSPRQGEAAQCFHRDWDNLRAAHSWALTVGDVAAATLLVNLTLPYAAAAVRQEHSRWTNQTIAAYAGVDPSLAGASALWANISDDHESAIAFAQQGIAAAPEPHRADTVRCWVELANAYGFTDQRQAAREAAASAAEAASHAGHADQMAAFGELCLPVVVAGAAESPPDDHVGRLGRLAAGLPSPSVLAAVPRYRGALLRFGETRELDAALVHLRAGLDHARSGVDARQEASILTLIASVMTAANDPGADHACADAIERSYDLRAGPNLWSGVADAGLSLATRGHVAAAAAVVGHLEAHRPPPLRGEPRRIRRRTLELVLSDPHASADMARGATMGRDSLVRYLLDALRDDRASPSTIRPIVGPPHAT